MSESNNIPKTNSSAKKTLVGLLIFGIVCVAITYACIYMTLENRKQTKDEFAKQNDTEIVEAKDNKKTKNKVLKLIDKSNLNGIAENQEKEHYGDVVDYYEYNNTYSYKLEVDYFTISGLKDRNVQATINQAIQDKVDELKEKYMSELDNKDIDRISITATMWGNYADVLSVRIDDYVHYDYDDDDYENDTYDINYYGLNFSLKDGERLQFKDIFWEDSPIKTILSQSAYKSFAWDYAFELDENAWENGWDWNMDHVDYSEVESRVYNYMYKYNKNPDIEFYFTTSQVQIPYGKNEQISIDMADFYEYIGIYTKYKSEKNLYEDNSNQKEFYVFAYFVSPDDEFYSKESGLRADNVYYAVEGYDNISEMSEEGEKAHQEAYRRIIAQVNEYTKTFKEDKEHGYVIVGYYTSSDVSEYDFTAGYNLQLEVARCDRDYFDNNLEYALAAEQRKSKIDISPMNFCYIDEENFEFFETYYTWADDYKDEFPTINVYTKEDRERDMAEWENYEEESEEEIVLEDFSEENSEN